MNFLKTVEEILLGLTLAIIIPALAYWGINIISPVNITNIQYTQTTENLEASPKDLAKEQLNKLEIAKHKEVSFWVYLFTAILTIFMGALIKVHSLSIGFIGSGIYSLLAAIFYTSATPLNCFAIFCLDHWVGRRVDRQDCHHLPTA